MTITEFVYTVLLRPPPLKHVTNVVIRALLPECVQVGEARVHLNPKDPVVSGALMLGVFERGEIAFFRSRFRPDMTLIDIGANVGLYSALALSTHGFNGRVLAIEPHSESRLYLQRTVLSNGNHAPSTTIVCDLAASNQRGTAILYKNSKNKGDNRLYPDPLLNDSEAVCADTLDNICQREGIRSAQFVKVDVQGAEALVVSGAKRLLSASDDCILMTEFWPYGLSRCGADALKYLNTLRNLGFELYQLSGRRGRLFPISNGRRLIERTQGRRYANLIGLKGILTA